MAKVHIDAIGKPPDLIELDGWYWRYCVRLSNGRHAHLYMEATHEEIWDLEYVPTLSDEVVHLVGESKGRTDLG